jgi:hypothetical protein
MYFEVRNTIKHRAHKRAHEIVAQRLLERLETEEVVGEEK